MAGKSRQVTIQFLGDARSFVSATGKATKASDTFGSKLKSVGKAAIVGFGLATVAAGKVMYEFADAAVQDQKAAALLANSLRNATGATKGQIAAVEDWISKQGELYGVTDDDLRPALSKLATATGSITKAQKLASLAMDVSAGTGKDLSSITLALAKAQTGSLAGLGRLGIATKDAAGKTKTLAQVTDDLSKKYKGSAATAADTAAGKFQRLKVSLSETGEAIGYKLLPYANDLGDWLLKTGVPALEGGARAAKRELTPALKDLSGFVSDNKDEFADLGHEVVQTIIPAFRDAGSVVGGAVKFFTSLPAPVKLLGLEAGIAALALPRLAGAVTVLGNSMAAASVKSLALRRGLGMAAGVGGMVAISEGARTGNKAVSLLGASLTGAFVGGTLGSAIPVVGTAIGAVGGAAVGAGIGLFRMHKQAAAAGDSSKDASPKIDGLAESLNQVTGAATRATKALILQKLTEDGVVSAAGQLGIATSDLIKSVNGNEKAIARVNDAWSKNGDLLDGLQNQKITLFLAGMRQELGKAEKSVKDANAALDGTDRSAKKAGNALKGVGKERPGTNKWQNLFSSDLDVATADASGFSKNTRRLLGDDVGKTRANMRPFGNDLISQLTGVKGRADRAGAAIGNAIKTGFSGALSNLASMAQTAVSNAVAAAQAAAGKGGGKGKGGRGRSSSGTVGNVIQGNFGGKGDYGQALLDQYGGSGKRMEIAGGNLIESITKGLKKGERTLKNVLSGIHDYIKKKTDALSSLLDERASFVDQFRNAFSESIFSAQFADAEGNTIPPTIQKMMEFAKQQQANAHQLAANIKSLISKGLSKDMLAQLVGQGQSGYDQIAALASGTQAEIDQFNQINADIKSTLEGLGEDIWAKLNPAQDQQITLLTDQVAAANRQEALLQKIADAAGKDGEIKIRGTDLVILLRHIEKTTGQRLLVTPA